MARQVISLAGIWNFGFNQDSISDTVRLPGTTDENKKGDVDSNRYKDHLTRRYTYSGPAWYEKIFTIPENAEGSHFELYLERTRACTVYLDDIEIGFNDSFSTPHRHNLGYLKGGQHKLTLCVNNAADACLGGGHANSDHTQTNWNGVVGRMELRIAAPVRLEHLRVFPDIATKIICVEVDFANDTGNEQTKTIKFQAASFNSNLEHVIPEAVFEVVLPPGESSQKFQLDMTESCLLWNEFEPNLYRLNAVLGDDAMGVEFAMREFAVNGTRFAINGLKTFLRGKHDACVFPLTGYAPMELEPWLDYMRIMREYGINHIRCHSWCLPEAAFRAADRIGLYLQPELPNWNALLQAEKNTTEDVILDGFGRDDAINEYDPSIKTAAEEYMLKEGMAILKEYGSYGSFVMFALGNELAGNTTVMARLIAAFRERCPDKLYAQGSNNHFNDPQLQPGDDYWTTFSVAKYSHYSLEHQVRASFSYANQGNGGAINALQPGTRHEYSKAIAGINLPIIGHETGQYQFFPDFDEIERYTGVVEAKNFEESRQLMARNGILEQWREFNRAAGRFASLLYKEDMEQGIRTNGFGGFQLLDLQDFPGQGTALVGILNSFLENKGHITPNEWRMSCNQVTLLARFDKFVWSSKEKFRADVQVANFGPDNIAPAVIEWSVPGIISGTLEATSHPQGELSNAGSIEIDFPQTGTARRYDLNLKLGEFVNTYPLWVYPALDLEIPENIRRVSLIDTGKLTEIESGGTWLWTPDFEQIKHISHGGLFMTDYWSFTMFKMISERNDSEVSPGTLGLQINDKHPALDQFPTEYHSNWQWRNLLIHGRPLKIAGLAMEISPIVQPIDNMWRQEKLALIFEFRLGRGKILCANIDFNAISDKPEAAALLHSLSAYISSDEFNPAISISPVELMNWLN